MSGRTAGRATRRNTSLTTSAIRGTDLHRVRGTTVELKPQQQAAEQAAI
jgi:hypothetical protein